MPVDLLDGMGVVAAAQQTVSDWVALRNQVHHALLRAQASQKHYADARHHDVNFNVGYSVLLATKNLRLQGPRKLHDHFVGPFRVLQKIGKMVYKLDVSGGRYRQALSIIHDIFHVSLLRPHRDNGLGTDVPPIVIDEYVEFEVEAILKHRQIRGEDQYLVRWKGYDQSEDMWLNRAQLEHSAQLLEELRRQL